MAEEKDKFDWKAVGFSALFAGLGAAAGQFAGGNPQSPAPGTSTSATKSEPEKKDNTLLYIVLSVFALIILVIVAYLIIRSIKK